MTSAVQLYSLKIKDVKTYFFAILFIGGNILLPRLCHSIPNGGHIFLPIYFFTLIGAYKYGWKVGMLTAIGSPIINHILFGMPPTAVLPALLVKSSLLAVGAAYAAYRFKKVSLLLLFGVVLFYQIAGCLIESAIHASFAVGFQDFVTGIPGMLIQILGSYALLRYVLR